MTVGDLWGALRRRWMVMVVALVITGAVSLVVWREPGVYWASTKVYLLVPATVERPNQLAPDSAAAIGFAGLIEAEINGGVPLRTAVSPEVTLVDEGNYDGWSVLQPDTGGQWSHDFPHATLIVQASGPTPEAVTAKMNTLTAQIERIVNDHEDAAHVPLRSRVTFTMSPSNVAVQYSNGHRSRAVPIITLLGLGLGLAACVLVDRVAQTFRPEGEDL